MKTTENYMLEAMGYGDEAKICMFHRDHMIAVVSFPGSSVPCELVRFYDGFDFADISPYADLSEVENIVPFTIFQGNFYNCMELFRQFIKMPVLVRDTSQKKGFKVWKTD